MELEYVESFQYNRFDYWIAGNETIYDVEVQYVASKDEYFLKVIKMHFLINSCLKSTIQSMIRRVSIVWRWENYSRSINLIFYYGI